MVKYYHCDMCGGNISEKDIYSLHVYYSPPKHVFEILKKHTSQFPEHTIKLPFYLAEVCPGCVAKIKTFIDVQKEMAKKR